MAAEIRGEFREIYFLMLANSSSSILIHRVEQYRPLVTLTAVCQKRLSKVRKWFGKGTRISIRFAF